MTLPMIRLAWIACMTLAAAALGQGAPAPSDDLGQAFDPAPMTACLDAAAEPAAKQACVGMAAGACMGVPGHDTTAGMGQCFAAERDWWDARLNETYNTLAKLHREADGKDGSRAASLKTAGKAWLSYRDAECAYQQGFFEGGSAAGPTRAACDMNLTAQRTIDLGESLLALESR